MASAESVVSYQDPSSEQELAAYWTPQAIASAIPLPFPLLPTTVSAGGPTAGGQASGGSRPLDGMLAGRECFTTSLVNDMTVFPYCAVGKLFMTFGGANYIGSAWVIGERTICTAGHCVYDHATGWATNVMFAGRFNQGAAIGFWPIPTLAALNGWINDRDFRYDIGFGIASQPIRPVMGKLGWMANYPANQGPYTEIGYPAVPIAGYPFDGQRMWQSVGNYVDGSEIIQACGNMTGGCSGGPWAIRRDDDWRGNGLNSHRQANPKRIYSPYFGDGFIILIAWMQANGGD